MNIDAVIKENHEMLDDILSKIYHWSAQYQLAQSADELLENGVKMFSYGFVAADENPHGKLQVLSVNGDRDDEEMREKVWKIIYNHVSLDYLDWIYEEADKEYDVPVKALKKGSDYAVKRIEEFNNGLKELAKS